MRSQAARRQWEREAIVVAIHEPQAMAAAMYAMKVNVTDWLGDSTYRAGFMALMSSETMRSALHIASTDYGAAVVAVLQDAINSRPKVSASEVLDRLKENSLVVYAIRSGDLTKIGVTGNLEQRMNSLQNSSSVPLELLGTITGGYNLERFVHRMFSHRREHGEWFRLTADDLEILSNLYDVDEEVS